MKISELLDSPEKWTRGAYARDSDGCGVAADDPTATRWCLIGAAERCYGDEYDRLVLRIYEHLKRHPAGWNDSSNRTYEDVIALVRELDL